MKYNCEIICDLLPLYCDNLASPTSKAIVEEHLNECESCKKMFASMQKSEDAGTHTPALPLKTVKRELKKRRLNLIGTSACLVFLVLLVLFAYVSSPVYISAERNPVTIRETDGKLYAEFSSGVTAYNIMNYSYEDSDGESIEIEAWYSLLDRLLKKDVSTVLLSENASQVKTVSYCDYEGEGMLISLYSNEEKATDGGGMVLEGLVLGYYVIIAGTSAIVLGILWLSFRQRRIARTLRNLFFVPISYLIGHLLIMGTSTTTYYEARNFLLILTAAAAVYGIIAFMRPLLLQMRNDRRIK